MIKLGVLAKARTLTFILVPDQNVKTDLDNVCVVGLFLTAT